MRCGSGGCWTARDRPEGGRRQTAPQEGGRPLSAAHPLFVDKLGLVDRRIALRHDHEHVVARGHRGAVTVSRRALPHHASTPARPRAGAAPMPRQHLCVPGGQHTAREAVLGRSHQKFATPFATLGPRQRLLATLDCRFSSSVLGTHTAREALGTSWASSYHRFQNSFRGKTWTTARNQARRKPFCGEPCARAQSPRRGGFTGGLARNGLANDVYLPRRAPRGL